MGLSDQIKQPGQILGASSGASSGGSGNFGDLTGFPGDADDIMRGDGSASPLSAADIPNHSAALLTTDTLPAARLPGVLADVDTQAELLAAAAAAAASHAHSGSDITSGTVAAARLPALSALSGAVTDGQLPSTSNNSTISAISTVANAALPKAGGQVTGYLELGGSTGFNSSKIGLVYANSMPHLQNTGAYLRVNGGYVEVNKGIYFAGQAAGTGATEVFSDGNNNLVHYAVTTKSNRAQAATTAVAGATFVTVGTVSGIAQGLLVAVVTGMGSILMDWDGTTLTKLAGAATLVVAGSAGGTEVAFRVSGTSLQASNGTGASKNVSCPLQILQ